MQALLDSEAPSSSSSSESSASVPTAGVRAPEKPESQAIQPEMAAYSAAAPLNDNVDRPDAARVKIPQPVPSTAVFGQPQQNSGPGTELLKHVELCKSVLALLLRCTRVFGDLHGTASGLTTE